MQNGEASYIEGKGRDVPETFDEVLDHNRIGLYGICSGMLYDRVRAHLPGQPGDGKSPGDIGGAAGKDGGDGRDSEECPKKSGARGKETAEGRGGEDQSGTFRDADTHVCTHGHAHT